MEETTRRPFERAVRPLTQMLVTMAVDKLQANVAGTIAAGQFTAQVGPTKRAFQAPRASTCGHF